MLVKRNLVKIRLNILLDLPSDVLFVLTNGILHELSRLLQVALYGFSISQKLKSCHQIFVFWIFLELFANLLESSLEISLLVEGMNLELLMKFGCLVSNNLEVVTSLLRHITRNLLGHVLELLKRVEQGLLKMHLQFH